MSPEVQRLIVLVEEMITFREDDECLTWEAFLTKQAAQHETMRSAIGAVQDAEHAAEKEG